LATLALPPLGARRPDVAPASLGETTVQDDRQLRRLGERPAKVYVDRVMVPRHDEEKARHWCPFVIVVLFLGSGRRLATPCHSCVL
jgi:hypothetical protein